MATNDSTPKHASLQKLDSTQLAAFIVDALLRAGIVQEARVQQAIEIAAEEIEVCKVAEELVPDTKTPRLVRDE